MRPGRVSIEHRNHALAHDQRHGSKLLRLSSELLNQSTVFAAGGRGGFRRTRTKGIVHYRVAAEQESDAGNRVHLLWVLCATDSPADEVVSFGYEQRGPIGKVRRIPQESGQHIRLRLLVTYLLDGGLDHREILGWSWSWRCPNQFLFA